MRIDFTTKNFCIELAGIPGQRKAKITEMSKFGRPVSHQSLLQILFVDSVYLYRTWMRYMVYWWIPWITEQPKIVSNCLRS